MSETAACRDVLAPFCVGLGLDMGFGGSAIVPDAITFDMKNAYTSVGSDKQIMRGTASDLSMFCDDSLDYIYSSHLIEDWNYGDMALLLTEWRRVIKPGGLLITNCPDQQKFLAHVAAHFKKTGQDINNLSHKEPDFGLAKFMDVLMFVGKWEVVKVWPAEGVYSWYLVVRKVAE